MQSKTQCPIDGCSYSSENANSVVAHITSKIDDDHRGLGYQDALTLIDADAAESEPVEPEADEPEADASSEDSDSESQSTSNPAFGGPERDPSSDSFEDRRAEADGGTRNSSRGSGGYGGPYACPRCGGEPFDFRNHHDPPAEFVCSDCEAAYNGWEA